MTLDEYIVDQFNQNIILFRGLWIGQIAASVAGIALAVAAVAMGKAEGVFGIIPVVAFLFHSGLNARDNMRAYAAGLKELQKNPVGIASRADICVDTKELVFRVLRIAKDQFGLIFAYGTIALTLVAASVLLFALYQSGPVYVVAGVITLVMGAALIYLSAQAIRSWRAAKQLEAEIAEARNA